MNEDNRNNDIQEDDDFLDLSSIKEEVHDGPSEEEFTKAMETMTDTDRDIFENTGIIHVDRDMPAETQAMRIIELQKENNKKKRKVVYVILSFMILAVVICGIGLYAKQLKDVKPQTSVVEEEIDEDEEIISIDTAFPDTIFRTFVQKNFDKDGDNTLNASERNAVIMIIAPSDASLTSLQGIEYFPYLQSLTFSNTGVSEVNLSQNTELTSIDCSNTPISNLILPQDTKIESINTENTALSCTQNEGGYYNACSINQ